MKFFLTSLDRFINDGKKCFILNGLDLKLSQAEQNEGHRQYSSCSWMDGWMEVKSRFKDCCSNQKCVRNVGCKNKCVTAKLQMLKFAKTKL
jgi:hypothetical protein